MCDLLLCSKLWIIVGLFLFFLFFLASPGCYVELVVVFFILDIMECYVQQLVVFILLDIMGCYVN